MEFAKKISIILLLIFISKLFGNEEIINKVIKKYDKIKTYQSEFSQENFYNDMSLTTNYLGEIIYNTENLVLNYSDPKGQFLSVTNQQVKMYDPASNQLLISSISDDFNSLKPISILKKYVEISENVSYEKENFFYIELLPENDELTKIEIKLDKGKLLIYDITYYKDEDFVKYTFKNEKINQKIPQKKFNLKLPEDTQIIRR